MKGPPWDLEMVELGWMGPEQRWALGMDGPPWTLGMDGPWAGMGSRHGWALGMDGPPRTLRMDGLWEGMGPGHGWVPLSPLDRSLVKDGPPAWISH